MIEGPVDRDGASAHGRLVDGTEITRVRRVGAIVAHDPDLAFGNRVRIEDIDARRRLERRGGLVLSIGLVERHPVYVDDAFDQIDRLAARGDGTLDQRAAGDFRVVERDDVSRFDVAKVVGDLLGPDVVADFDRDLHRA